MSLNSAALDLLRGSCLLLEDRFAADGNDNNSRIPVQQWYVSPRPVSMYVVEANLLVSYYDDAQYR